MKLDKSQTVFIVFLLAILAILFFIRQKNKQIQNNAIIVNLGESPAPGYQTANGFPIDSYGPQIMDALGGGSQTYNVNVNGPQPWNFLTNRFMPLFGYVGVYGGRV